MKIISKTKKLSNREQEIITLMSKGLSNKDISIKLEMQEKTVSTYVQRIRLKLNLDKNSNAYIIVSTYQKINFPMTQQPIVCEECQEVECECTSDRTSE